LPAGLMVVRRPDMSTSLINKVSSWAKNAQFWLMPGVCIACQRPSGRTVDLCAACRSSFVALEKPCIGCALSMPDGDFTGPLCGKCLDSDRLIYQTVAAFAYQPPLAGLIGQFKYREKLQHGRVLTDLLLDEIRARYQSAELPQLLMPVPLHPARLRERGYNQALLIAQHLGKALHIPVAHDMARRVVDTSAQQGLNARERKQNLRGAFALKPVAELAQLTSVVLIDDVVTTMSTAREIARLIRIKTHPKLAIHVWCLARA
jgi:ComF family protein